MKLGFKKLGYVKNLYEYIDILQNMAAENVELEQLNQYIENEISNNAILYFNKEANQTSKDSSDAKYMVVKTGYTSAISGKDL